MDAQLNNQVLSSFKLFLENRFLSKGNSYTNTSGYFFTTNSPYNGYYCYSVPFQPIVCDSAVGATIMSGVYLDNTFITTGNSGFVDINYEKGMLIFSSGIENGRISGNYSFADLNIKLTSEPDSKLLFETKYQLKPKIGQINSGLKPTDVTFPIIYLKDNGGNNRPFAFGGQDLSCFNIRAITITDSQFLSDACNSIMRDCQQLNIGILSGSEFPYDSFGGLKTGYYNYTGLVANKVLTRAAFIKNADITPLSNTLKRGIQSLPPYFFISFADFVLERARFPRL